MKKILIIFITILSIILIVFIGWFIFLRDKNIPAGEAIGNLLPFGSGDNLPQTTGDTPTTPGENGQETGNQSGSPTNNLIHLSPDPVAGAIILTTRSNSGQSSASTTIVRYVDRATGHIYDINPATMERTKITNQTLPKIYEAYFKSDGNAVLLRSLINDSDIAENLSLILTPPKTVRATSTIPSPQESEALYAVSSVFLRGDIGSVAVGSGDTLFYNLREISSIFSSSFNNTKIRAILNFPFTDWRLATAENILVLSTKASAHVSGYTYTLNLTNGALTKLLGPLYGLTTNLNAGGNRVLYSYNESGRIKLFAKNLNDNKLSELLPTTLAEKCVWSIKNTDSVFCGAPTDQIERGEPDAWYKGATHFSDRIWLFDTKNDVSRFLAEPKSSLNVDIDVSEPKISPKEDYLIFTNHNDLSLWALKLE